MGYNKSLIEMTVLVLLLAGSFQAEIQCEYGYNSFDKRRSFLLNEREKLIQTIYPTVDILVDNFDGTISKDISNGGAWKNKKLRGATLFVKPGDTVLNVGSHIGLEAINLGKIVGPTGKLFIWEPVEATYRIVRKNIFLNNLL